MTSRENESQTGPLSGLRVVEMGTLLAGPFAGQLLGDLGAEVIKVEEPTRGDPMRQWGREKADGRSLWWPIVARNKKSVTLDLRRREGQEAAKQLVSESDILIENFRPGTLERWGLGYDELSAANPGLIMVRVTGFGQDGPYAHRAGFGAIGEAMGGLRYVTGDPSAPPSRVGISIGDALAATKGAFGALAALHERERTGRGQVVDSAIYEAVLAYMESLISEYDIAGYIRERTGPILPKIAPSNIYPTADGQYVLIAANQDTVFRRLTEAMKQPELATDERFATHSERGEHQEELDQLISRWSRSYEAGRLLDLLEEHGVPAGQIYRAPEMLEDSHFAAREAIVEVHSEEFGQLKMQNVTPKLSRTPGKVRWPGPDLGQHDDEVLGEMLGLSAAEIDMARGRSE